MMGLQGWWRGRVRSRRWHLPQPSGERHPVIFVYPIIIVAEIQGLAPGEDVADTRSRIVGE